MALKRPLDKTPYPQDPRARRLAPGVSEGRFVYVQDALGAIWHLPDDKPHLHPRVLGNASPAMYAGDLTITQGVVTVLTNLSGTFQFDDAKGLIEVAKKLVELGYPLLPNSVRLFPNDGSRPLILLLSP